MRREEADHAIAPSLKVTVARIGQLWPASFLVETTMANSHRERRAAPSQGDVTRTPCTIPTSRRSRGVLVYQVRLSEPAQSSLHGCGAADAACR